MSDTLQFVAGFVNSRVGVTPEGAWFLATLSVIAETFVEHAAC